MDDREEFAGVVAFALIAGKAVGHQMRSGGDSVFQEPAQFGGAGCR